MTEGNSISKSVSMMRAFWPKT